MREGLGGAVELEKELLDHVGQVLREGAREGAREEGGEGKKGTCVDEKISISLAVEDGERF